MSEERPGWFSVTNMLVAIALAVNVIIWNKICDIDNKVFTHLTNSNIHIPRESVVSRDEFSAYQVMRDRQIGDLREQADKQYTVSVDNNRMLRKVMDKMGME